MMERIFSLSSGLIPMLSKACRVPQSGQISVSLSFLDSAGGSAYAFPHSGQTRICRISLFIFSRLHTPVISVQENVLIKTEGVVAFQTGSHVKITGDTDGPVLMHNVNKSVHSTVFAGADTFVTHPHFPFVVEVGKAFIAVERGLVCFRHRP